ncbi:hypothetical protein CcaverHIS641_0104720 [Cutaneotrichosporon cavernicola]|nr:hypothetical protein CcaverHIS641_0104720 [Cutaneotrichosporon cavernicola]
MSRMLMPSPDLGTGPHHRLLRSDRPNPDAPIKDEGPVDPAARGVNEMRRQWGGLIDGAEKDLADEAAASRGRPVKKEVKEGKEGKEGLKANHEPTVDPASRGVNEMHRQWGELVDDKKKKCMFALVGWV